MLAEKHTIVCVETGGILSFYKQLTQKYAKIPLLHFQKWAMEAYLLFIRLRSKKNIQIGNIPERLLKAQEEVGIRLRIRY